MNNTLGNIVRGWMEEDRAIRDEQRRAKIAALPRIKFLWGRNWYDFDSFCLGIAWDKNPDAQEGEIVYRRELALYWRFRVRLIWH